MGGSHAPDTGCVSRPRRGRGSAQTRRRGGCSAGPSSGRRKPRAAGRSQLRGRARRGYPAARNATPRVSARRRPLRVRTRPGFSTGLSRATRDRPSDPEPWTRASRSRERSPGRTHRPGRQRARRTAASGLVTAPPAGGVHTPARWRPRRRGQ